MTFSEDVVNVDMGDFEAGGITGATLTATQVTGSSSQYDVKAEGGDLADLNGTVTLSFASSHDIKDTANNALDTTQTPSPNDTTFDVDNTAPTVTSIVRQDPAASPTNANSLTWRVTFDEDVANVDNADFTVTGTMAAVTGVTVVTAPTVYDVTVSGGDLATLDATVTLSFAGGQDIADASGNALDTTGTPSPNDVTFDVDNTKPTVTITDVPDESDGPFTAVFTFSEAVNDFTVDDIAVVNGTAAAFTATDAMTWTARIAPDADGAVTVNVAADVATDAAGNGNTAATQARIDLHRAPDGLSPRRRWFPSSARPLRRHRPTPTA